jgi:hypothetical protein
LEEKFSSWDNVRNNLQQRLRVHELQKVVDRYNLMRKRLLEAQNTFNSDPSDKNRDQLTKAEEKIQEAIEKYG